MQEHSYWEGGNVTSDTVHLALDTSQNMNARQR
jgi:hypothetical protein